MSWHLAAATAHVHQVSRILVELPPVRPLPVTVTDFPGPDSVAWLTLRFAVAGAVIAFLTLLAVGYQIYLSRRELKAVETDLAYNRTQLEQLMLRPNIRLWLYRHDDILGPVKNHAGRAMLIPLTFSLSNEGEAAARDISLEVLIPASDLAVDFDDKNRITKEYDVSPEATGIYLTETQYLSHGFKIDGVIYAADGSYSISQKTFFYFRPDCKATTILWRVFDQYGSYPNRASKAELPYGTASIDFYSEGYGNAG
jgi:hypothetical protein